MHARQSMKKIPLRIPDGVYFMKGGRRCSWDKPPKLTDVREGSAKLKCMGGRQYRWDSYRAPSHEEFISQGS